MGDKKTTKSKFILSPTSQALYDQAFEYGMNQGRAEVLHLIADWFDTVTFDEWDPIYLKKAIFEKYGDRHE